GEPTGHGAFGDAKLQGGLFARFAFQITKGDERAILFRKATNRLIEKRQQRVPWLALRRFWLGHLLCWPFACSSSGLFRLHLEGHMMRDSLQPASKQARREKGASLASQDEERRLEGVLGIVMIAQNAPASAQNHWPVPAHEQLKGCVVSVCRKAAQ